MPPKNKRRGSQVVAPNTLDDLPENIIDAILMRLPLRDAVRTSTLSKKWRYNWCRLPELTLDQALWEMTDNRVPATIRFTNIIYQLLTLHHGPISKLTLSIATLGNCPKIDNLICFLSRNGIQHLVLEFPMGNLYRLPSSFFTYSQIRHVSLHNCSISIPPDFQGFDKLVILELTEVAISSKFVGDLISCCPVLERLVLNKTIKNHIQITAPKLRLFDFFGRIKYISLKGVPLLEKLSLVESKGTGNCDIAKFIEPFSTLERLHLNGWSVLLLAGEVRKLLHSPLNCLKRLYLSEICLDNVDEASCVLYFLRNSPYLQHIEIQLFATSDDDDVEDIPALDFRQVESFSDFTWNHLRVVKIRGLNGIIPEMELIQLLLAKSPQLIRMLIEPRVRYVSPETRIEVLAEITKFRRASPKAEVVYKVA